ncbi:YesL family protein [Bifidobacterium sp.]|uniref:YesL family protein n=1 Tax=Bifidobacterium sp. TaxID=41200 RepID=UPI0039ECB52A
MSAFGPESAFMRGLSTTMDSIWINVLLLVTSIPIVTIGASLTAACDAARRMNEGRGHLTANYFRAFRSNFVQSTQLWLIIGPIGTLLLLSWIYIQITPLIILKIAFSIIWLISFLWVWPMQARFENKVSGTLTKSFLIGMSKIGVTLALALVDVIYLALVIASWFYMPSGLFILILFGYGSLIVLHVPLLEYGLRQYTRRV